MNDLEKNRNLLDAIIPIPLNLPLILITGPTGNGKTSLIRQVVGTEKFKFPSVQQSRTTVAPVEYVRLESEGFEGAVIFKSKLSIANSIYEIVEYAIEESIKSEDLSGPKVCKFFGESPDQTFRLKYILDEDDLMPIAENFVNEVLPEINAHIEHFKEAEKYFDFEDAFPLAVEKSEPKINYLLQELISLIEGKVSDHCSGFKLFENSYYKFSADYLEDFITNAKKFLSNAKGSFSPLIAYARLQGNFQSEFLPVGFEGVIIDGQGVGHDVKDMGNLSSSHFDFYHISDCILLIEEASRAFIGAGVKILENVIRSGYEDKLVLAFSKLDLVFDGNDETDCEESGQRNREELIEDVDSQLKNLRNSLRHYGFQYDPLKTKRFYFGNMHAKAETSHNISEFSGLIGAVDEILRAESDYFIEPIYEYDELSELLDQASRKYSKLWSDVLTTGDTHWATIKALSRRIPLGVEEFNHLKPVSDLHNEIMVPLGQFFDKPAGWEHESVNSKSRRMKSVRKIKMEFSHQLLCFSRELLMEESIDYWQHSNELSGVGSTFARAQILQELIESILPYNENIFLKNRLKKIIQISIEKSKPDDEYEQVIYG